jgi:hypothetical protein
VARSGTTPTAGKNPAGGSAARHATPSWSVSCRRADFAAVLAGRGPHTGARLITAQGSAGRRPTLGSGAHTRTGADGERLYSVADTAAALGVSRREVERMLDVGTALALGDLAATLGPGAGWSPARPPARHPGGAPVPLGHPTGPPARPPVRPPARADQPVGQPAGSYLVPLVEEDGSRWVWAGELQRCVHARDVGVDPEEIRATGDPDDQFTIPEAARLAGVTNRYLRGLARYHDEHRDEIERSLAAGRHPRRAFLVAHRDGRGRWLVDGITNRVVCEFSRRRNEIDDAPRPTATCRHRGRRAPPPLHRRDDRLGTRHPADRATRVEHAISF